MRRFLLALALLLSFPALGQTPARVGPLSIQNALGEIQSNGPTAQGLARGNLGLGSAAVLPSTAFDAAGLSAAETTRATQAEAVNAASVVSETTRALIAEGVNATAVTAEKTRATAAEAVNAAAVTSEIVRATGAEGVNATAIATEATARGVAVSSEAAARTTAVAGEATTARAAESTNATAASAAQTTANTAASAGTAETTRATAAEAVNATSIASETTRALTAEGTNASAVASEIVRATGAEGVNTTAITTEATTARNAANLTSGTIPASRFSGSDSSGANVTATGTTGPRSTADRAADLVNVKDGRNSQPGAKGDGQIASPVVTLSGTSLVTAAATFTAADVGKTIVIAGAGIGPTSGPPTQIAIATPGATYSSVPACAVTDASGTGLSATCAALMVAQSVTLTTGGATCTNGAQTFLVGISTAGTNNGTPAQVTGTVAGGVLTGSLTVTAPGLFTGIGAITSLNIYGANCATPPTVSVNYGVGAVQVTAWGNSLYSTTQTTAALTGGSPASAATLGVVTIGAPVQPLITTIAGFTSPTQATLAAPAISSIGGVATQMLWASNDGPAFQNALNAGRGIWIPAGFYWIGSVLDPGRGPMSIRGEGMNNTILAWDAGSSAVQNVGNWTQLFKNTAGSSTAPTGFIQMEDFQIRGLMDFGRINLGAAALELNNYYQLKLSRMKFLNIPFMAMQPESIKVYSVRDSVFENVFRDQARCRSCFDKTVTGSTFIHSGDDSIAFHQANYITAAGAIGEAAVVTGNTFEDTQGIDIIGGRDIIVTGNICRRMKGRCLTITGAALEGQNQLYSINISNNQALDTLGASTPYQAGGGVFNLSFAGAGAPTGITNFVPGANNYPTTYFGKPWDYMSTVAVGNVGFAPAVRGINIHDNTVMRTLPSTTSYALWGFGAQLYGAGWISAPVTDATMLTTAALAISANATGTIVHHNDFMDTLYAITVNDTITVPTEAALSITFNHFYNNYGGGIMGFGSGTMANVDVIGNVVDVDPYLSSPGRSGNHGGWSNAYASSKCISWGYTGPLTLAYNTFSDCYSIPTTAGWKISKNTIRGQPSASSTGQPTAWQSDAYGIGVYPTMAGDNFYVAYVALDPSAALPSVMGAGLSAHPLTAAAAPTTGYHVINDMVWSTAPGTCACQGWLALTSGSAWVAGTDYKVVPVQ